MRDAGLDASQRVSGGFGIESRRVVATAMLMRGLPDVIIAADDDTALGVLITLRHAIIQIPRQISVVAVDNTKYSQLIDLTTVHLPTGELAALAALRILDRGGPVQATRTIPPHGIVQRGRGAVPGFVRRALRDRADPLCRRRAHPRHRPVVKETKMTTTDSIETFPFGKRSSSPTICRRFSE